MTSRCLPQISKRLNICWVRWTELQKIRSGGQKTSWTDRWASTEQLLVKIFVSFQLKPTPTCHPKMVSKLTSPRWQHELKRKEPFRLMLIIWEKVWCSSSMREVKTLPLTLATESLERKLKRFGRMLLRIHRDFPQKTCHATSEPLLSIVFNLRLMKPDYNYTPSWIQTDCWLFVTMILGTRLSSQWRVPSQVLALRRQTLLPSPEPGRMWKVPLQDRLQWAMVSSLQRLMVQKLVGLQLPTSEKSAWKKFRC